MFGGSIPFLIVASMAAVPGFGGGAGTAIAAGDLCAAALAVFASYALFVAGETSMLTSARRVSTRRLRDISLQRCR